MLVTPGPAELPRRVQCLPSAGEKYYYQATAMKCQQSIEAQDCHKERALLFNTCSLLANGTAI